MTKSGNKVLRLGLGVLSMTLLAAQTLPSTAQVTAQDTKHDWQTVSPEAVGFPMDLADKLTKGFDAGKYDKLHSVVIVRHGKLVLERHFRGQDERWGDPLGNRQHAPDTKHDLRSVSKSIVGLLYGVALQDGKVPPLDASLVEQFPDYPDLASDPKRRAITISDTLAMKLGLEWNEDLPYTDRRNSEIAMEYAPDRYRFILERPIVAPAGEKWRYSGGSTAILAHLVARGTGRPLMEFARERLFGPLGIEDVEWVSGSNGEPAAASGLRMRASDLAKIGQMILDKGQWNGQQIVPEAWLQTSFETQAELQDDLGYARHWWVGNRRNGDRWIAGFGNGGQRLFIFPKDYLTVVIFAGNYNQSDAWRMPVDVLVDVVFSDLQ